MSDSSFNIPEIDPIKQMNSASGTGWVAVGSVELIFTRVYDQPDPEWGRRIRSTHVPQIGNLVKFPDETGDMIHGKTYRVDAVIWSVSPDFGITQVEVRLIDV